MALLGIDIGGTKTIVAVADAGGSILAEKRISTPREQGPTAVLAVIESALNGLLDETRTPKGNVTAIGIGCGGPLDPERGIILTAPNLPGWENLALTAYFEKAFHAPAYLDNDVTLAALGEAREGAGVGIENCAYFNVGTGVGGGIIIGGRIYRGAGNAGEFGHQIILPDGPSCLCGKRGCLESLVSGTSIARRAREQLASHHDSLLLKHAGAPERVTVEHVAQAAREGDEMALGLLREAGEYLGLGVANVINILNPSRIIIGGGVIKIGDSLFEDVRRTVRERAMDQLAKDADIVPAKLGDRAGIVGTIYLALEGR